MRVRYARVEKTDRIILVVDCNGIPVRLCMLVNKRQSTSVCLPHVKPPCRCNAMNEYDVNFVSSLEDTVSIEISTESKFFGFDSLCHKHLLTCVNGEVGVFVSNNRILHASQHTTTSR